MSKCNPVNSAESASEALLRDVLVETAIMRPNYARHVRHIRIALLADLHPRLYLPAVRYLRTHLAEVALAITALPLCARNRLLVCSVDQSV
jgi:hypothetical protein